jgi:FlaA1/EpsC-like NDP-sugar epimerase
MNQKTLSLTKKRVHTAARSVASTLKQTRVRIPLLIFLHTVIFSAIYVFSFLARYDFAPPLQSWELLRGTLPAVVLTKLAVFYFGRSFHGWWRYVTFADLGSLLRVSLASMLMVVFVDYYFLLFDSQIPRLTILLDTITTILVVGGLRCSWRFFDEQVAPVWQKRVRKPAIMVGTGHVVGQLSTQLNSNQFIELRVAALASLDATSHKTIYGGVPVAGQVSDIVALARKYRACDVLVPAGTLSGKELRELIQDCNAAELKLRVIPRMEDAIHGNATIPLRPLVINDLLKRDPVKLDTDRLETLFRGKTVLITGAGGSIGSEICRQVLGFDPSELILVGRGENRIHAIHLELQDFAKESDIVLTQVIANITDAEAMRQVFSKHKPDIVFHAAAHKHVPLMELHVGEAIKNNVHGTKVLAALSDEFGVGHFVLVSSDKAVNPTSVMGCTKHLAERIVHEYSQMSKTKFVVVRFGNVLGSAGSVIPVFQKQIEQGGPITITDPRMTRFFMSIPEAAQLVMQSAAMSDGGEIYVLDMGEQIPIVQLAEDLVSLSGLPRGSIEFEFTGARQGEKLFEELYFIDETTVPTAHQKVRAAKPREPESGPFLQHVQSLLAMADDDPQLLREQLRMFIPSYSHCQTTNYAFESVAAKR